MAPSEAQRAGHLKKPLKFRSSEALKKIGVMAYALRHGSEAVITFAPPLKGDEDLQVKSLTSKLRRA